MEAFVMLRLLRRQVTNKTDPELATWKVIETLALTTSSLSWSSYETRYFYSLAAFYISLKWMLSPHVNGERTCSREGICHNLCYNNFTQGPNKRITKCDISNITIKDAGSSTSNYVRYLKMHPHTVGESLGNVNVDVSTDEQLGNMFSSASALQG